MSEESWALHASLPPTLSTAEILEVNPPRNDLHTVRSHTYRDWEFELPPGVFRPGETSKMIHDRLLDGRIPVAGRTYVAMGSGLGVEAVTAGIAGASRIYALDVHPASVAATEAHYRRFVGETPPLHAIVSDLFTAFPDKAQADVITFNPPAVALKTSEDPDVVRNVCVGAGITARFFDQVLARDLLAPGGEIHLIVSNTANLRDIIAHAIESGFVPEVRERRTWPDDDVQTYLFRLRAKGDTA
ncbi:methyltransferase [Amycolatopsis lurida]